jgi:hypothetical protein
LLVVVWAVAIVPGGVQQIRVGESVQQLHLVSR